MIIGVCGEAFSGKSTAAQSLIPYGYIVESYAKPLKAAMMALTGLPAKYFYDPELKFKAVPWIGMSPRDLMQKFGTDFVRDMVKETFFVDRMREKLKSSLELGIDYVIDDIRFENEADLVQELGGVTVKIVMPWSKKMCIPGYKDEGSGHRSEIIDFPCDYEVVNAGSTLQLRAMINKIRKEVTNG